MQAYGSFGYDWIATAQMANPVGWFGATDATAKSATFITFAERASVNLRQTPHSRLHLTAENLVVGLPDQKGQFSQVFRTPPAQCLQIQLGFWADSAH